jgi:hypothetical protein
MGTDTVSLERLSKTGLTGRQLDAVVSVLSVLMVTGVALDFRRHAQGISFAQEGFFTPEHTFFYSMFLGIAAVIGAATYRNRRAGSDWIRAVPTGYGWGVIGVFVFGFGGGADFVWHSTFGFEEGVEGLTSPSHHLLAIGAVLFLASPLRAAWYRREDPTGLDVLPVIVSTALSLSLILLFAAFINPIAQPVGGFDSYAARVIGVTSVIVFPLVLVAATLALVRRFQLPPGALTFLFLVPGLASATPGGDFIYLLPVALAGLVADGLVAWRRPIPANLRAFRAFGALVPLVFGSAYFLLVEFEVGIAWTVHIWTGAVTLAALTGLMLTYAIAPAPRHS